MNKEKVKLIVFNTLTNKFEETYVTPEIARVYKKTEWVIEKRNQKFFKNEIQFTQLKGGNDGTYENFKEFISNFNWMHEDLEKQELIEKLQKALVELEETDYRIIYLLFYQGLSESECAKEFRVSQQMISKKKARILKKLKNFLI